MVTDNQVRMLMKLINKEETLKTAAAKAGTSLQSRFRAPEDRFSP